jgi:hypothetical protein
MYVVSVGPHLLVAQVAFVLIARGVTANIIGHQYIYHEYA